MIDVHCHLVYGVDDGSANINETLQMLKEAKEAGFTDIILTPHYSNYFNVVSSEIEARISKIKELSKDLGINLYHGNEIYITSTLMEDLKNKNSVTLNNSKYVLFEVPLNNSTYNIDEVVYSILNDGKVPIMAHPERYDFVQENPNWLLDYIDRGVLFQSNYASVLGWYGKSAKETVKKLLTHNMVHFLGSDNHKPHTIYEEMPSLLKTVEKLIGKDYLEILSVKNPQKVLNNENIEIEDAEKINDKFFMFWKK